MLPRGLLRDDHATGRPLVYRPTPQPLQLLGAEALEAGAHLKTALPPKARVGGALDGGQRSIIRLLSAPNT
jgi:hypothetical protein